MTAPGTPLGRAARLVAAPQEAVRSGILSLVADKLEAVESLFQTNLASPLRIVEEIGSFVADSGGKRVRPTLHLLCARACRYEGSHDVLLATVLEFIHSATLIHDDIIDDATTRRGRPSVNHRWGNNVTVLFGDYLYAKAMEMALRAKSLEIMERLADVTLKMTEGEMLQTRYEGRIDLTEEEHLDLVERKTAELFSACCELAGVLAGVDKETRRALRDYGRNLGMAFQLVDDLLDFTGDAEKLGKPAASDLREGKVTLALIDLLSSGSRTARELALRVMENGRPDAPEIGRLTRLLRESGAIERTYRRAQDFAARATRRVEGLRDAEAAAHRALRAVPEMLIFRDR